MKKLLLLIAILFPLYLLASVPRHRYHVDMPKWFVPFPKELLFKPYSRPDFIATTAIRGWYFSEANGNNTTGTGTRLNPYHDLGKSISTSAGDSIFFERGGDYSGKLSKATNNLWIDAYGIGADPRIIYAGADAAKNRFAIYLSGSGNTVSNLNITYPTQTSDRSVVAYVSIGINCDGGSNNVIRNCSFSKIGIGIFLADNLNNLVDNCIANDLRMVVSDAALDSDYGSNFIVMDNSSDNIFSNNNIDSCFAPSVDYQIDGGAIESYNPCSNNLIIYNIIRDCDGVMEIGSGSGGTSFNNRAFFNLIINSSLTYTSASGGFPVQCDRMRYWFNTIMDTLNLGLHDALLNYAGSETSDTVFDFRGNIAYVKGGVKLINPTDTSKFKHGNNICIASSGSSIGYTFRSNEKTSTINAEFVSMSTGNYHLKSTAYSRGYGGTNLGQTHDLDGVTVPSSNPDIGAYQYVGITPPPPSNNVIRIPFILVMPSGARIRIGHVQ